MYGSEFKRTAEKEGAGGAEQGAIDGITGYPSIYESANLADMDYGDLAAKVKLIAIDEMRHAEMFAERIKELGGEPTADLAGKVEKGQKIEVIFSFDAGLEDDTMDVYNQFLLVCRENGDSTSIKLFETIVDEEQIHYNYFDNVSDHIKRLGPSYLAQIAGTPADTGPPSKGFVTGQAGQ